MRIKTKQISDQRIVASGTNLTIAANTTVTVATVTRQAGEVVSYKIFVTDNVNNAQWAEQGVDLDIPDTIAGSFQKTGGGANEFKFLLRNSNVNLADSRTVDWMIKAYKIL